VPLKRGMILSNEPGYYKTGEYGIRIENLILVVAGPDIPGADKPLNAFETLTLAPIDRRLIDAALLTGDERNWIDRYHEKVFHELTPSLDGQTKLWLAAATATLGRA
jgi:Xaa-Pro aminopeptidase